MKKFQIIPTAFLVFAMIACQAATPPPALTVTEDVEFTLAPDQIAVLADSNLTVKLISVPGDSRCPSEIECAESGPVSVSLSVQMGNDEPLDVNLQTFTDTNGRAPGMVFEGIQDRIEYEGHIIRVTGVLPYPVNLNDRIGGDEYRVTFVISKA
jgi:hypothetical protein